MNPSLVSPTARHLLFPPAKSTHAPKGYQCSLPDGTPLYWTITREVLLGVIFDELELDANGRPTGRMLLWSGPATLREGIIGLYVAAETDVAKRSMLADATELHTRALTWADEHLNGMCEKEISYLCRRIWPSNSKS